MKKYLLIPILLVLLLVLLNEIYQVISIINIYPVSTLSSPFGNTILGISRSIPEGFYYFHSDIIPLQIQKQTHFTIYALSPALAAVIFFILSSLFLIIYARIKRLEKSYIIFSFIISIQYISFIDYILNYNYLYLFYFTSFLINISFLKFYMALFDKTIRLRYIILSIFFSMILVIGLYPENASEERKLIFLIGLFHFVTFIYAAWLLFSDYNATDQNIKQTGIKRVLAMLALLIIFIPAMSYTIPLIIKIPVFLNLNVLFFIPTTFPMLLIFVSLKYGCISFERPVKNWFIRVVYFIFFAFVYWFLIGFQMESLIYNKTNIWLHLFLSVFFIFAFDMIRSITYFNINQYDIFRRFTQDIKWREVLTQFENTKQLGLFLERFIHMLKSSLEVQDIFIIVEHSILEGWSISKSYLHSYSAVHPIWYQLDKKKEKNPYTYLLATDKDSAENIIKKTDTFIIIPFHQFKAAIVLSERNKGIPFFIDDIKFVHSAIKHIEPILTNFRLLVQSIQTRKMEKELEIVSNMQYNMQLPVLNSSDCQIHLYRRPFRQVTGDYIDVIPVNNNAHYIFLGDVTGHGLASGYLLTMVRSTIYGSIEYKNYQLSDIFFNINSALSHKNSSSSLMTLCGIFINKSVIEKEKYISISFINAGQHAALIYQKQSGKIIKLEREYGVLGVTLTEFKAKSFQFQEDIKLIILSDGAFEVFNEKDEMLGEEKLTNYILSTIKQESGTHTQSIIKYIFEYSSKAGIHDDISILMVDYNL